MNILIINGHPDYQNQNFDNFISELTETLIISGHLVKNFILRNMNVRYCEGCFNCWIKTPGECVVKDDSQLIRSYFIMADLVILASPIIMGFTSALLKKIIDKLIPLALPYFEFYKSEVHHANRYKKFPDFGILLEKSDHIDQEDIEITRGIYNRNAMNMKSSIVFSLNTQNSLKEIVDEINGI